MSENTPEQEAPSGRGLPTESGGGESVNDKTIVILIVTRAPSVGFAATFLPEEGLASDPLKRVYVMNAWLTGQ